MNPIYLAGPFGVELPEQGAPRLVSVPHEGRFHALDESRLPYYAGTIEYAGAFELDVLPSAAYCRVAFGFSRPFVGSMEVSINGGEYRALPWAPYTLRLRTRELSQGENTIAIREYTSRDRMFDGERFDLKSRACVPVG